MVIKKVLVDRGDMLKYLGWNVLILATDFQMAQEKNINGGNKDSKISEDTCIHCSVLPTFLKVWTFSKEKAGGRGD